MISRKMIIVNSITFMRIITSLLFILFLNQLHSDFLFTYLLIGLTDVLDGYLARVWDCQSKFGAKLDSFADLIFYMLIILIYIKLGLLFNNLIIISMLVVLLLKLTTIIIGCFKYKQFVLLHTYANKAVGFLVVIYPLIALLFPNITYILIIFVVLAAVEELYLVIISKKLNLNHKGILFGHHS